MTESAEKYWRGQIQQLRQQSISPPSANFNTFMNFIMKDPLLANYFSQNLGNQECFEFTRKLLLDGIRYRAKQSIFKEQVHENPPHQEYCPSQTNPIPKSEQKNIPKRYNVAYIKHNRFLSPKQRKYVVTPKVTEMIPAKSPPHVIYGKPKVKLDQGWGCPYHSDEQQETLNQQKQRIQMKTLVDDHQQKRKPETPKKNKPVHSRKISQTRERKYKDNPKKEKKVKESEKQIYIPDENDSQTVYVQKIVKIDSRNPGRIKIVQSPIHNESNSQNQQYLQSRYALQATKPLRKQQSSKKIESKIKYLIDRDKNNKHLEKKLKKQEEKIQKLEKQFQQATLQNKKPIVRIQSKDVFSLSGSSGDSFSSVGQGVVNAYLNHQYEGEPRFFRKNEAYVTEIPQDNENSQIQVDCSCSKTYENHDEEQEDQNQESFAEFQP